MLLPLILASTSPRRKEIMDKLCLPYEAVAPDYEEDMTLPLDPITLAKHLALGKAASLQNIYTNHVIIGSDTFCALEGKLLGKPKSKEQAADMLDHLSGKTVSIMSGLAVINTATKSIYNEADTALVYFNTFTESQKQRYLESNEWTDKAGAFAVQGIAGVFIHKVEGDYNTIMGLPLPLLYTVLQATGYYSG